MQNLRRGINRIFTFLLVCSPLAAESGYLATIDGAWSLGSKIIASDALAPYDAANIGYIFTDYGGRLFRVNGEWGMGFSLQLYSAFGGRSDNYRASLGWVPLQVRARKTWLNHWIFTELGTGPAYGFGAAEYVATPSGEKLYHKYSEWGWLASAMIGIDMKLHTGLSLQIFTEGAYIFARVRNPGLTQADSIDASQFFLRPGVAVALRF